MNKIHQRIPSRSFRYFTAKPTIVSTTVICRTRSENSFVPSCHPLLPIPALPPLPPSNCIHNSAAHRPVQHARLQRAAHDAETQQADQTDTKNDTKPHPVGFSFELRVRELAREVRAHKRHRHEEDGDFAEEQRHAREPLHGDGLLCGDEIVILR